MPKFIKLTNIEKDCSHLNICSDSIERFHRQHPVHHEDEKEHTRVYLKGHGSWHNVSETTEEVEALIKDRQLTEFYLDGELVHI